MANYDGLIAESVRMQGHNGDEVDAYLACGHFLQSILAWIVAAT